MGVSVTCEQVAALLAAAGKAALIDREVQEHIGQCEACADRVIELDLSSVAPPPAEPAGRLAPLPPESVGSENGPAPEQDAAPTSQLEQPPWPGPVGPVPAQTPAPGPEPPDDQEPADLAFAPVASSWPPGPLAPSPETGPAAPPSADMPAPNSQESVAPGLASAESAGADTMGGYSHSTQVFVYESLADAGDTILSFRGSDFVVLEDVVLARSAIDIDLL